MRIGIALLLVFLVACGGSAGVPQAPLDRKKFEQVLMESLLIEARVNQEVAGDKRTDSPAAHYYEEMFKKEGVTEADFNTTYNAYVKQPDQLKSVYQDVLNDLQQRADSASH